MPSREPGFERPDAVRRLEPPPRALAIWRGRPDLQAIFNLDLGEGREALTRWYFLEAYRAMGLSPDPAVDEAAIASLPAPGIPRLADIPVTWLMVELWAREQVRTRDEIARRYPAALATLFLRASRRRNSLRTRGGQERMLRWYFTRGLGAANLLGTLSPEQSEFLNQRAAGTSRILQWIWKLDRAARKRFSSPAEPGFAPWAARNWPVVAAAMPPSRRPFAEPRCDRLRFPFGVNVIGHARGRSGVSEDVRMAANALVSAGTPCAVHDLGTAEHLPAEDQSLAALIRNDLPYAFNLFSVTGMDNVAAVAADPCKFRDGRFSIGFWPWELPSWPPLWAHAYDFVDEVWASSQFTFEAHRQQSTIPVRQMPMAVSVAESEGRTRSDFAIPEDPFLFSFALDGLSSLERKNPQACVEAFRTAFPDRGEKVGLVIKGLRVEGHPGWQALQRAAEQDPRIILIARSLSRGALLDLHRLADCFVSLHRAEGFGRNIAECMMLGKPVISTDFSGNTDFTLPDTAALVPAGMKKIEIGEYPFAEGQSWAEPDVAAAAALMRRMVDDPAWRTGLAERGQAQVTSAYAIDVVGRAYEEVFRGLWDAKKGIE